MLDSLLSDCLHASWYSVSVGEAGLEGHSTIDFTRLILFPMAKMELRIIQHSYMYIQCTMLSLNETVIESHGTGNQGIKPRDSQVTV